MERLTPLGRALRRLALIPFCHRGFVRIWPFVSAHHRLVRLFALLPLRMRETLFGARVIPATATSYGHTVAIVTHELSASGVPRVALETALAAQENGSQTAIFSPSDGPFSDLAVDAGISVVIDPTLTSYLCNSSGALDAADVVFVNSAASFKTVLRLRNPSRCIWYFHETGLIDTLLQSTEDFARAVRRAGRIWAVSDLTRQKLDPLRTDISIVPAGARPLSISVQAPKRGGSPALRLALIGGVEPRKGQDLLADALEELPAACRSHVEVVAYGAIKDQVFAEAWLRKLARISGFVYGGALAPKDVGRALEDFDGVIIPSRDEPFSLVAVEAMSCGRLVLCTRCCGVSEHLTDGVDAFIADDATPASIAALLQRTLEARATWRRVGVAALQTFERLFSQRTFGSHIRNALGRN